MLLGFKTELKLNNLQRTLLAKHAGVARHAWNWGLGLTQQILDHNRDNPSDKIKFPTGIDLHKWLVALVKPICPWYYEVSKCAPQYALRELSVAWKRAFKKTSKPPRFKRKGKHDSFTLDGSIKVEHNRVRLPTKTCSQCHTEKDSMPLSERVFRCDNCGFECDRDLNASFNLEQAAS
ncbi:MAG: zinc ribbon domain-containing protein [Coleofasciculus sp. G3-WIS-01]